MIGIDVVVPNDIDDPAAPSGGNAYDRALCHGLAARGWPVREHPVTGAWPYPSAADRDRLAATLAGLADGAVVVIDGLVASVAPRLLTVHARRLRLVVLVHMPLGEQSPRLAGGECAALSAAAAIVTTSSWTRRDLLSRYPLAADRVHVATPGVDPAPLVTGAPAGSRLLCVAAIAPHKGHDVLASALAMVADVWWDCVCVGPLDRDRDFVDRLRRQVAGAGIASRMCLAGTRATGDLDAAYAGADLLVLASRGETYGMVVTEALARGIPVLASRVGGVPEALGHAPDGSRPGMLVPPGDAAALAGSLRSWLTRPDLRAGLRAAARGRRSTLPGWAVTADVVAGVVLRIVTG